MRRWTLLPVTLITVAAACVETGAPARTEVETDTGAAGVPFELVGPGDAALVVPVRLNGRGPYDFILDTGATLTCVDEALADSLALPEAEGRLGVGAGVQGAPGTMRLVRIDSISVGEASAEGMMGCALDLAQLRSLGLEVRGLLGLNFLTSFRVTLDFVTQRLTLAAP